MSGPKRNPDKLNTIGVVVVGICGAVMVYVTIVALQAFYMNDTSEIQTMADYGGQDTTAKSHRADEMRNITETASNGVAPGAPQTYRIPIDHAIELLATEAKAHPDQLDHFVPALPPATTPTIKANFGRPEPLGAAPAPAPAPAEGAGSGAGSAAAPAVTPPADKKDEKKADKKDEKKAEPAKADKKDEKKAEPKADKKAEPKAPAAGSAAAGGHAP